jgi:lysophospholipase L1-like esterase
MTLFFIEPLKADAMRARMDSYGEVITRLAQKHDAILVDTQAAFDAFLVGHHSAEIAWDRIHPNHIGHMILARAFLDGIGFDWAGQASV